MNKISKTSYGVVLLQSHYVEKILNNFYKDDSSIAITPIDISVHLSKNKGKGINQLKYSRIIRSMMCVMNKTRPDITCPFN